MDANNRTKNLIRDLIDSWKDFYYRPEYYLTKHIPEIIANPQKRTLREDLFISCINNDPEIIPLINTYYQNSIKVKLQAEVTDLLDAYKFLAADEIYKSNKDLLPKYEEQRNEAHQSFIKMIIQQIESQLKMYRFFEADQLFQRIKDSYSLDEYLQSVSKYKERQSTQKIFHEIEEKFKAGQFSEAWALYNKVSHLYPKADFEQKVLDYQIRYELNRYNFDEADRLITKCNSSFLEKYQKLKTMAIQQYFNKPDCKITDEQAAVLAETSKSLLIKARAGSGKTRVLASKTALLIDRFKINPDRILILAFNKKAAHEIGNRINKVYKIENFENGRTFHSLAYQLVKFKGEILFDAQGEFSRLELTIFVQNILRSIWSPEIQSNLYRLFRKELISLQYSGGLLSNSDYLAYIRNMRDITLNGDRVKSKGEKFIGDYLFEHEIPYFYERVEFWSGHSYRPDFSLFPESGQVIIEFWGIDEQDRKRSIPADWDVTWDEYHAQMEAKRNFWKEKGIPLIEMSVADLRKGRDQFEIILEDKLANVGLKQTKLSQKELENKVIYRQKDRMTGLFVQFIQRAKKLSWSVEEAQDKVRDYKTKDERTRLFLNLGCQVYKAYQNALVKRNAIDFDDLLIKASEVIKRTKGNCTLDLGPQKNRHIKINEIEWILVDEFQDFSSEFNHLLQAIYDQNPTVNIVCVGDDWQAINSFAGSDTIYFKSFQNYFHNGKVESIVTNHRSQKAIVDFGNQIMALHGNPGIASLDHQSGKVEVRVIDGVRIENRNGNSFEKEKKDDQRFIFYEEREKRKKVIDNGFLQAKYLKACYQIISEHDNWEFFTHGKSNKPIIAILSRTNTIYRVTLDDFREKLKKSFSTEEMAAIGDFDQKVKVSTVHGFKGLEAEIVILLRVCTGSFPLLHPDNSLFEIFGQTENHVLDEERRLFYVGVTRPSQKLYILTEMGNESSFIPTTYLNYKNKNCRS